MSRASGQASKPLLRMPSAIAYDASGNLFIADTAGHQVWEATLAGKLVLVAGSGVQGFSGDGGSALAAQLNGPQGIAVSSDGTVFIADTGNHRVRQVSASGVISTLAGDGIAGFGGDGGDAKLAQLRGPTALAVDGTGRVLVCDTGNHRVRRVSAGVITTFAGSGKQGFAGDGGVAVSAELDSPAGIAVAPDGRVFVSDTHNQRVRVVGTDGIVSTVAGTGRGGFGGDGAAAASALLSSPRGLALNSAGELLIADEGNQRVRLVDSAGVISTVAGSGVEGAGGDGLGALSSAARGPRSVAVSGFGIPVFADRLNGTVRELSGAAGLFQPAALAPGRTSTVTAAGPTGFAYGQPGSTAVSVQGAAGTARGGVELSEAGANLSTAQLAQGTANVAIEGLGAGQHHVVAAYGGDGLNPASQTSFDLTVAAATLTATASSSQVAYGLPVPPLAGTLSGVLPKDAGSVQASFSVPSSGALAVGIYPITATLSGAKAPNYAVAMSSSSGSLQVVKAGTTAVLGSVGQSFAGMPLVLNATVAPTTSGQPTGIVQFLDGSTVVATATLGNGSATATYAAPPLGARSLSVQYLGDSNFLPTASAPGLVQVAAMPDFSVAAAGNSTTSVAPGAAASYSILVGAGPGPFTGAVSLSAAGLPPGASVSFSPPQVVPGNGSASVTVLVQTAASQATAARGASGRKEITQVAVSAGVFCCLALFRRRRRVGLLCMLSATFLLGGCGARQVGEGLGGVLAHTYTVQVTGTATNLAGQVVTHGTALTLTVQQ